MVHLQKKQAGSHHRFSRINRHSLRDGLRLISRSPRGPGFLAPVAGVMRSIIANLTSASGGRDHATSPSAISHVRPTCHPRPSHPRPTCRDDSAYVPLHRGGMGENIVLICPTSQARRPATDWHDGQFAHGAYAEVASQKKSPSGSNCSISESNCFAVALRTRTFDQLLRDTSRPLMKSKIGPTLQFVGRVSPRVSARRGPMTGSCAMHFSDNGG